MSELIREIQVLALDGQASGATPAHGDLIELGWATCSAAGDGAPIQSRWVLPRTERRVARAVRELTGWSEACLAESVDERVLWAALCEAMQRISGEAGKPTVIHFARFELPFLRDLHERLGSGAFPFDTVCLHAVALRLFPDLPRRNIRALAGYLGHSPELLRRSAGHVEATVFIWRALVPLLEQAGVSTWSELKAWLEVPVSSPRRTRRVFPLAPERRLTLPDRAGVYRFLRRNGDVIYVGKATSLKKRVASHFKSRGPTTERGLELLSQVHELEHVETPSLLEAALLECDEIKRLDPPYNVQLRSGDRNAWFATRDFSHAAPVPGETHPLGPLPSERALSSLAGLVLLADGGERSPRLMALALAVPSPFLPDPELFDEGFRGFAAEHLARPEPRATLRVLSASRALWDARGRTEPDASPDDAAPDVWDLARVRRRLERNLVGTGLLVRRARWLCLLADGTVAFRERAMPRARALVIEHGEILERFDLDDVRAVSALSPRRLRPLRERKTCFDAAVYDRLRTLVTELRRILDEGGELALRLGTHLYAGDHLAGLLRVV